MLDLSMLEKRFDWMYIAPSSTLRSSFEKILNSKTDKEKLRLTLQEQARQLSCREASGELELIKQVNDDPLLQPLFNVVCRLVYAVKGVYQPEFNWNRFFD